MAWQPATTTISVALQSVISERLPSFRNVAESSKFVGSEEFASTPQATMFRHRVTSSTSLTANMSQEPVECMPPALTPPSISPHAFKKGEMRRRVVGSSKLSQEHVVVLI